MQYVHNETDSSSKICFSMFPFSIAKWKLQIPTHVSLKYRGLLAKGKGKQGHFEERQQNGGNGIFFYWSGLSDYGDGSRCPLLVVID